MIAMMTEEEITTAAIRLAPGEVVVLLARIVAAIPLEDRMAAVKPLALMAAASLARMTMIVPEAMIAITGAGANHLTGTSAELFERSTIKSFNHKFVLRCYLLKGGKPQHAFSSLYLESAENLLQSLLYPTDTHLGYSDSNHLQISFISH